MAHDDHYSARFPKTSVSRRGLLGVGVRSIAMSEIILGKRSRAGGNTGVRTYVPRGKHVCPERKTCPGKTFSEWTCICLGCWLECLRTVGVSFLGTCRAQKCQDRPILSIWASGSCSHLRHVAELPRAATTTLFPAGRFPQRVSRQPQCPCPARARRHVRLRNLLALPEDDLARVNTGKRILGPAVWRRGSTAHTRGRARYKAYTSL